MISLRSPGTFTGAGILSAVAASLCCVTPLIALIAGTSSIAASFSWIEPLRPYLIVTSVVVLAFAWYLKLKPAKSNDPDCNCERTNKTPFLQTKTFLSIVSVVAVLFIMFPFYAKAFYPVPAPQRATTTVASYKQQANFAIQGMTCEGCEEHINLELSKMSGVLAYKTSYLSKNSVVTYDQSKVNKKTIEAAINKTGYKVTACTIISKK